MSTPLVFLCSTLSAELRDLEKSTLRWSPTQGRQVIRDGAADALVEHVAKLRELVKRIEDEHAVRLRLVEDVEPVHSAERDARGET